MQSLRRVAQIASFMKLARSPGEAVRLGVMGVARGHPFGGDDVWARVGRRWWPSIVVRPRGLGGVVVEVDPRDLGHLISFEEIVVHGGYDLARVGFEPSHVIDCGAHIGLFSILAAKRFPAAELMAIEPNPTNAAMARRQFMNNSAKISLMEAAVSTEDGEAFFEANWSNAGSLRREPAAGPGGYRVKVLNFPRLLQSLAPKRLLLKMDIEGEEERIVPVIAPTLPQLCAIFLETHGGEAAWSRVTAPLIADGFQIHKLRERGPFVDSFLSRG